MKKVGQVIGRLVFWVTWPGLWLLVRWSRRTRLLLVCGDEFLAVRGWLGNGEWGLPGGGLHRGEEPIRGLLREVQEETGLTLALSHIKPAFQARYQAHGLRFNYQAFVAEMSIKPALRPRSWEITEIIWQPLHKPTVRLTEDTKAILAWWQSKR